MKVKDTRGGDNDTNFDFEAKLVGIDKNWLQSGSNWNYNFTNLSEFDSCSVGFLQSLLVNNDAFLWCKDNIDNDWCISVKIEQKFWLDSMPTGGEYLFNVQFKEKEDFFKYILTWL